MLQDIRSNIQGTMAKIIIGLIVISFSIFGIESLLFSGGSNAVAEVNGDEISAFALQQEVSLLQRQLLGMLGENADPALLDETMLTEQATQSLVQRTLVTQAADDMQLTVSDQIISEIIASMEQFQIDGQFSRELFQSRLASSGFTPSLFRQRLVEDVLQTQLRAGIGSSSFVTEAELDNAARISAEERDLRYVTLPLGRYRDAVSVDEAAIREYYESNSEQFMSPESLDLDYLELTLDDYREPVDEARVREEFDLVRDEFEVSEDARVSHILFEGAADDRAQRLAEARAAIDAGMEFADAAANYSDDIGSSAGGGDLGYTAGDTFPEPMEEAIARLAVGEMGSVETEAGTHLLLVTDRRAGSAVTFAEVRDELEQRLQERDASAALLSDVERLRDIAFNAADLTAPAAELQRSVQRAQGVTRSGGEAPFDSPRLLRAAFSEDVLEAGHNSEVIELSPQRFLVLRVARRNPPAPQPLADVRAAIAVQLRDAQALDNARQAGEAMLQQLRGGASVEQLANDAGLEWQVELGARRDSTRLAPPLRQRLFALPVPAAGPVRDLVAGDDTLYVLELTRVTPGSLETLSADERAALRRRLAGEDANTLLAQYEAALRADADITVY